MVILLIFTLKRDVHWGGKKLSLGGRRRGWGVFCHLSYIVKKCPFKNSAIYCLRLNRDGDPTIGMTNSDMYPKQAQ